MTRELGPTTVEGLRSLLERTGSAAGELHKLIQKYFLVLSESLSHVEFCSNHRRHLHQHVLKGAYLDNRLGHDIIALLEHEDEDAEYIFLSLVTSFIFTAAPDCVLPIGYEQVRYMPTGVDASSADPDISGLDSELAEELVEAAQDGSLTHSNSESLIEIVALETNCVECTEAAIRAVHCCAYRRPTGHWEGLGDFIGRLVPPGTAQPLEAWLSILRSGLHGMLSQADTAISDATVLTPTALSVGSQYDAEVVHEILHTIRSNGDSLASIHWRVLEEIVAELLKLRGMEVMVTPRSGDGGRDVVARGELVPGEPTYLAVEVKHKKVVGPRDVRDALFANRYFPLVMLATSGRFSSGVLRIKREQDTFHRLVLADGRALRQWIDEYTRGLAHRPR